MSRKAHTDAAGGWVSFISGGDSGDIQIDNDGEMENTRILVDLSRGLSQRLGRQMSMLSTYKVDYVRIDLVNKNDGIDNDGAAAFGGRVHYWSPSKHRINAMQIARAIEKIDDVAEGHEKYQLLVPLDEVKTYKGVRFNWDGDGQVIYDTSETMSSLAGSYWDLEELFDEYEQGVLSQAIEYTNQLWDSGRCGYQNQFGWSASYTNYQQADDAVHSPITEAPLLDVPIYAPSASPFELSFASSPIEVLGGLMMIDVESSSSDSPFGIDDDYSVMVTVGVRGWSDF